MSNEGAVGSNGKLERNSKSLGVNLWTICENYGILPFWIEYRGLLYEMSFKAHSLVKHIGHFHLMFGSISNESLILSSIWIKSVNDPLL
jgi:hypothetical protein